MFSAIARLIFGGEEQRPGDLKSGEMAAEEWQVVSHQGQPEENVTPALGVNAEHKQTKTPHVL